VILNDRLTDGALATFHAERTLADLTEATLTGTGPGVVRTVEQA
jgi:hypothetical protein